MKSKSFDFGHAAAEKRRQNETFDFVNLYLPASENSASVSEERTKSDTISTKNLKVNSESHKRERSPNKRKKKDKHETIDNSQINSDILALNSSDGGATLLNESKVTSTPLGNYKNMGKPSKVKSIMKNTSTGITDDAMDGSNLEISPSKPKKRNKSVSFMLEDNENVVIKKTKSEDSTSDANSPKVKVIKVKRQFKKVKKNQQAEKENTIEVNQTIDVSTLNQKTSKKSKTKQDKTRNIDVPLESIADSQSSTGENVSERKKKKKRVKKTKNPTEFAESEDITASKCISEEVPQKTVKPKKKKHQEKPDSEEPAVKSRKKDPKPDVIAADLENLSIGDNAHTLTNLLDEMTVVDKEKRKKLKQSFNKNKKVNGAKTAESEKTVDVQEKVKWRRRKWNKDTKSEVKNASIETTVVVENLPLSLLFSYKKVLAEHFVKFGLIKSVGIAEVYATEDVSKPVFTTTINFYSDGAAVQALEENDTILEGSHIRVKPALPPTETTLVVRSYGLLTTQYLSSMFNQAGRIRNIRHSVKGKHAMATFFIEFDGPEAVEHALKLATNAKIGGKKVYVSKFEIRTKKTKQRKANENEGSDADQSEDSQD